MLRPLLGRGRIAARRPTKCAVEMVFRQLYLQWHGPKQRRGFRCSRDSRCAVAGVNARLQLANPIAGRGNSQPGVVLQMLLEVALAEFRVVEGVEVRCLSAKQPDQSELRDDDIADEAKPRAPHE